MKHLLIFDFRVVSSTRSLNLVVLRERLEITITGSNQRYQDQRSYPIHILEKERIRREHEDYINRMEMLFTINPRPYNLTNDNTNVESFSSLPILIQEEINVVSVMDDVLPLSVDNDDSDEEVDAVDVLRVDNFIQNFEHQYSESEDSDFDNPPLPLPPSEPPDKGFYFEIKISVEFSLLSPESEDTIFDPGISD
nr:hypothetical protein [Tanacetum cinerariifolium]